MKPYLYIAKIRIQSALAYRFDVFSSIALQLLLMCAICSFWISVYGNRSSALGVTLGGMLTYTYISILMSSLFSSGVEDRIIRSIRKGSIATDMLKPVNLFGIYLSEDIGSTVVSFFQLTVPLSLFGIFLFHFSLPVSGIHSILFIISFILSYAINWLFSAIFGMWAFTAISMGPMRAVKGYIIKILSGSIIPIWFFPGWLQIFLNFLPFTYIYQLPLGIYIGKYDVITTLEKMGIQVVWFVILLSVFLLMQRKITTKVLVQGG